MFESSICKSAIFRMQVPSSNHPALIVTPCHTARGSGIDLKLSSLNQITRVQRNIEDYTATTIHACR